MTDKTKESNKDGKILYCSFCGKGQNEVRKLIAGPSVFICEECVDLCNNIIDEELSDGSSDQELNLYKPKEIKSINFLTIFWNCGPKMRQKRQLHGGNRRGKNNVIKNLCMSMYD